MNKTPTAIVFDMDGVLIDSKTCMERCWNEVINRVGVQIPFDSYFSYIGIPFFDILRTIGVAPSLWDQCEDVYFSSQIAFKDLLVEYPNTTYVLDELVRRGYTLGVVTSKNARSVHAILSKNGWTHFSLVVTPESCPRGKPNPDPLLHFAHSVGISTSDCIYIGDAVVDKLCAESAGSEFIHATWGYQQFPCSKSISSITDLLEICKF